MLLSNHYVTLHNQFNCPIRIVSWLTWISHLANFKWPSRIGIIFRWYEVNSHQSLESSSEHFLSKLNSKCTLLSYKYIHPLIDWNSHSHRVYFKLYWNIHSRDFECNATFRSFYTKFCHNEFRRCSSQCIFHTKVLYLYLVQLDTSVRHYLIHLCSFWTTQYQVSISFE